MGGEPKVNDNGTGLGQKATHGWSDHPRNDDFITGVTYRPLRVASGGRLPDLLAGGGDDKLTYLKFSLCGEAPLRCAAGQRYAFLLGSAEPAPARNFTLANRNSSWKSNTPQLKGTPYDGGWGIRREGDGMFPPVIQPGPRPPADAALVNQMRAQSRLPASEKRFQQSPGTNGYPGVDTYRDFGFYLIAKP